MSAPGSECARIPAELLLEERVVLGDRSLRQEYCCCEFVSNDDAVFDHDLILAAFSDDVKPLVLY